VAIESQNRWCQACLFRKMYEFAEQLPMPQMKAVKFAYGNGGIGESIRQSGIT
jgi:hypothetical protein